MEVFFQLLDCDYVKLNSSPIVRVFGKTEKGKTVCVFFENFYPYFYVLPKEDCKEELINFLKNEFKNTIINIEEVEKFLPFCYQKSKTRMLRIFLNDPSKTPLVRDSIIQKNFVENVFEADILFKYRFMVDKNLKGMCWYKVNGEPVVTSTTKTDLCIKASSIQEIEDKETNLKFLCIDIEIFPKEGGLPDPKKDAIAMISLRFHPEFEDKDFVVLVSRPLSKNYKNILTFRDEKEMLKEFLKIIDSYDPDIITGYNINNFDFPYILQRLSMNKLPKTLGRCASKQASSRKVGTKYRNSVVGRIVVDVFELIKSFIEKETLLSTSFSKMTRLKRYSLDDVAREFLGEGKTLNHKEILKYWSGKEEDIEKVIEYTKQDAKLTLRLLLEKNLLDKYYELAKVSGLLLQDVLDGGESVRVENLLLSEFNKHDFVLPNKPSDEEVLRRKDEREIKSLKGALVLEPEVGLHVNPTIYLDFACHPGDTKVIVKGKGQINLSDVKEGDYVLGKNGWHKVKKVWVYNYNGTLINVNGLKCTPNHKLPVLKEYKTQNSIVDRLAINLLEKKIKGKLITCEVFDKIAEMEANPPTEEYTLKSELIGILLAEGTLQRREALYYDKRRGKKRISHQYRVEININAYEKDLEKRIDYIFKKLWGIKLYKIRNKNSLTLATGKKTIFQEVKNLLENKEGYLAAGILRGFFEGDGTVNLVRKSIVMNQSIRNEWKLKFIAKLLNKLGIKYNWYSYKSKSGREIKIIEIAGKGAVVKFNVLVGGISKEKNGKLEKIIENKKKSHDFTGFYNLQKIRISTEHFSGKVYDLTLNSEPYYFANGILTHNSMYPSIFIYYNICPTTFLKDENNLEKIETPFGVCFVSKKIREGIIPKIISKLIKERAVVKKLLKISTDENEKRVLDAKQEALKRMANAFYGYTGYMRARVYSIEIANAITSCGRFLIQKTKEIVERDKRFKVIYGDTDSLFIKTNAKSFEEAFELGKEIEAKINAEIGNIVTTKIENVFKTLLILAKKRYAGLAVEETNGQSREIIVMKGIETVRRDWCDLTSKTLYNVLEILLKEQNPKKVFDFVKDVIKKIEKNEIPIEDLVITKSISKPLSTYKGVQPHIELVKKIKKRAPAEAPAIGDRVGYVIIQGPQLISERAEDPEYVKAHNLKVDSRYYIESQILPPLERVFDVLGIKKSELLGIGKQALLADIIKKEEKTKKILSGFDGIICSKCLKTYRRIPLLGKCLKCGGELLFYSGTETARCFAYEPS